MKTIGMPAACAGCKLNCPFVCLPIMYRQACLFVSHNDAFNAADEISIAHGIQPSEMDRTQFLALDWEEEQRRGIGRERFAHPSEFINQSRIEVLSNEFIFFDDQTNN